MPGYFMYFFVFRLCYFCFSLSGITGGVMSSSSFFFFLRYNHTWLEGRGDGHEQKRRYLVYTSLSFGCVFASSFHAEPACVFVARRCLLLSLHNSKSSESSTTTDCGYARKQANFVPLSLLMCFTFLSLSRSRRALGVSWTFVSLFRTVHI